MTSFVDLVTIYTEPKWVSSMCYILALILQDHGVRSGVMELKLY